MSPQERDVYQITFKFLMARFLERFNGDGLREKNLAVPLSHSTTLNEDQPRQIILVDKLSQYEDFLGPFSGN